MNAFMVIVLAALLVDYGLTLAAEVLNLRSMRRTPPAELEGVYSRTSTPSRRATAGADALRADRGHVPAGGGARLLVCRGI